MFGLRLKRFAAAFAAVSMFAAALGGCAADGGETGEGDSAGVLENPAERAVDLSPEEIYALVSGFGGYDFSADAEFVGLEGNTSFTASIGGKYLSDDFSLDSLAADVTYAADPAETPGGFSVKSGGLFAYTGGGLYVNLGEIIAMVAQIEEDVPEAAGSVGEFGAVLDYLSDRGVTWLEVPIDALAGEELASADVPGAALQGIFSQIMADAALTPEKVGANEYRIVAGKEEALKVISSAKTQIEANKDLFIGNAAESSGGAVISDALKELLGDTLKAVFDSLGIIYTQEEIDALVGALADSSEGTGTADPEANAALASGYIDELIGWLDDAYYELSESDEEFSITYTFKLSGSVGSYVYTETVEFVGVQGLLTFQSVIRQGGVKITAPANAVTIPELAGLIVDSLKNTESMSAILPFLEGMTLAEITETLGASGVSLDDLIAV
jgi:hypothetical protein